MWIYIGHTDKRINQNLFASKNNFIFNIEKNTWFAMKPSGLFSLIGCTVAQALEFKDFELAPKDWKPSKFNINF